MAEFAAMPFWTDAYLADTDHLTNAEHGLYLRLLIIMWRSPECRVPNDDTWLERRLKTPANEVRSIIAEFCETTGNWVTQKRLRKEWRYVQQKRKKNRDSANTRWHNEKDDANAMPETQCERNAPSPSPSPSPSKKDIRAPRASPEFERFWIAYPKRGASNPRKPAYEKFVSLIASGAEPQKIISGAVAYAGECERLKIINTDKVAQAITWLRQERWADYAPSKTPQQEAELEAKMQSRGYSWNGERWVGPAN